MMDVNFTYQLANTAGYNFSITKLGEHVYDQLAYYHKENFPDVEVSRPGSGTDLSLLHYKALMTVNGYIYPTVYQDRKLYIPNATKSMLKSRANNIGILSFNKLNANLVKHSITPEMVTDEAPTSMFEKVILTFDKDIGHPILVICGYMVFEDPEVFYRVSSNSFALRLDRLNYIEKLYELARQRDIFKELDIPVSPNNSSMIDAGVARSNETIKKFLSTFNSFLVELPVDGITTKKIFLEHSSVPGNFRTELEPMYPIIVGYGKIAEYFKKTTNDRKHTVYINDAYYNQHLFSSMSHQDIKVYNDHRRPGSTYRLSQAFFLQITGTQS
jgi:hypothetical protein